MATKTKANIFVFKDGNHNLNDVPTITTIPGVSTILEKNKDGKLKQRKIRYIPGEASIYADEQSDEVDDSDAKNLKVYDSIINVDDKEVLKLDYLRTSGMNEDNKDNKPANINILYYEHKPDEVAQEANEKEEKQVRAENKVLDMTNEEVRAYGLAALDDPSKYQQVEAKTTPEVRQDLRHLARKEPGKFLDNLNSTTMKNKVKIMKGITYDIIKEDTGTNSLKWSSSGEVIMTAPTNASPAFHLAEMATKNGEHDNMVKEIEQLVKPIDEEKNGKKDEGKKKDWLDRLVEESIESKVVEEKGIWINYKEHKFKGREEYKKALKQDKDGLFSELSDKLMS